MLGTQKIIAFVPTGDPQSARAFYHATLGLRLVSEDPFALVFDAGGTMLRVTPTREHVAAAHTILGWQVDDIARIAQALAREHVAAERYPGLAQDVDGVWTSPSGARVLWFKDPDGNLLSLTQF